MQNGADLPQGGHGSFMRADTNFPQIWVKSGGNQKAKFVCSNNARIVKDIARILLIIIVGLDSLSPVECGCRIRVRFERAIPCNLCKYENAQQISASAYYICRIR